MDQPIEQIICQSAQPLNTWGVHASSTQITFSFRKSQRHLQRKTCQLPTAFWAAGEANSQHEHFLVPANSARTWVSVADRAVTRIRACTHAHTTHTRTENTIFTEKAQSARTRITLKTSGFCNGENQVWLSGMHVTVMRTVWHDA
jgi:hypothetical protein